MATPTSGPKPFIVSITATAPDGSFFAVVHAPDAHAARSFAENYFGDYRTDFRNHNLVSLDCSDFDHNYTFKVSKTL